MKILVIAPSWIGDAVLAQPLLSRLHQQHSHLQLDVLAPAWAAPVLTRMPEVHNTLTHNLRHGQFDWRQRCQWAKQIKDMAYDEAIILPNSWKSALIPWLAHIPKRTGFKGEWRYGAINNIITQPPKLLPRLQAEDYALLAGNHVDQNQPLPPLHLISTLAQQQAAKAALGLAQNTKPIVLCPGAEFGAAKRWPARYFAALSRLLVATHAPDSTSPIWLLGSAKDAEIGAAIAQESGQTALNLCGRTTLEQAIDLIGSAQHVVSNDSGLMHIAAALHRPLTAVFGSSSLTRTPPLSSQAQVISLHLPCSPCFQRECPLQHLNCLNNLPPERIYQTILGTR